MKPWHGSKNGTIVYSEKGDRRGNNIQKAKRLDHLLHVTNHETQLDHVEL